jgi:hypothetical protein
MLSRRALMELTLRTSLTFALNSQMILQTGSPLTPPTQKMKMSALNRKTRLHGFAKIQMPAFHRLHLHLHHLW